MASQGSRCGGRAHPRRLLAAGGRQLRHLLGRYVIFIILVVIDGAAGFVLT